MAYDLANLGAKAVCPTNKMVADDKSIPGVYVTSFW
jgi:hypothetical protein